MVALFFSLWFLMGWSTILVLHIGPPRWTRMCEKVRWNPQMFLTIYNITRWWFQRCFFFTPTWGNDPIWLIFFKTRLVEKLLHQFYEMEMWLYTNFLYKWGNRVCWEALPEILLTLSPFISTCLASLFATSHFLFKLAKDAWRRCKSY